MTHYSDELKTSIIARMLPPQNASVPALAKETGFPKDTLYFWRTRIEKQIFKKGRLNEHH